jgi:hypothetical protein
VHAWSALETVPEAARWAVDFTSDTHLDARTLQRQSAPTIVRVSVVGIAEACIPDPDDRLYHMLTAGIDECIGWLGSGSYATTAEPATVSQVATAFQ